MVDTKVPQHMYTRDRMVRNLGVGTIAEAFFRTWWEENLGTVAEITLSQFGYNPEGIVVGREKADMLKRLPRSPDFAVFRTEDLGTPREYPLVGISVNSQEKLYHMRTATSPADCYVCPRASDCHKVATGLPSSFPGNLWYNHYNITNDYRIFVEKFAADVLLVSIISRTPSAVWNAVKKKNRKKKLGFTEVEIRALINGETLAGDGIEKLREYLIFKRGKSSSGRRTRQLFWYEYSDLYGQRVPYSITGAPVNQGRPRPVACVNVQLAKSEEELIEQLMKLARV